MTASRICIQQPTHAQSNGYFDRFAPGFYFFRCCWALEFSRMANFRVLFPTSVTVSYGLHIILNQSKLYSYHLSYSIGDCVERSHLVL